MEIKIDKKKLENNVDKIYILEKVLMMLEPLSTTNPTNSERLLKIIFQYYSS